jgi:hypothetical protein
MQRRMAGRAILVVLACVVLFPLTVSGQAGSSIVGLVRDESGGVLPGVTVEAASPALIEKVRIVTTDEQGRYRVVDLRPGTYRLAFSLVGFNTVVRDGVELPTNFTATINADLKVGTLQETVTVSGQTPVVDVQQVSRTQTVTRDVIDALPVSRNVMSIGALVAGVRMGTPDIGGSRTTEQVSVRAHGLNSSNQTQFVEGLSVTTYEGNCFAYLDDATYEEVNVTTSALPADTSNGGVKLNIILKDGGNQMSGSVFLGGTDGKWQSDNVDDALRQRGITLGNKVAHVQQFTFSMGGPLVRDRFWWYLSLRHQSSDELIANVPAQIPLPDGTLLRGVVDNYVRSPTVRATYQVTPKNKLTGFVVRWFKRKGATFSFGQDPRASEFRDPRRARHHVGNGRWTYIPTSKWMIETGISWNSWTWVNGEQPGVKKEAFTPEWYAYAQKRDSALNKDFYPACAYPGGCTWWMSYETSRADPLMNHYALLAASYVTGTHNIKVGVQNEWGPDSWKREKNGDLVANYVNNRPQTVTVYNTPIISLCNVNYDIGVFAQDSWTIKRMTLNPGVRVQWFKSGTPETSMAAGRFAPARFFEPQPNLPKWGPNWAPRFSAAYDLFGDGRTALKVSASKYYQWWDAGIAYRYANAGLFSDSRNWFDADLIPGTSTISGVVLSTNGDGIAQNNEIGPSSNPDFGKRADRNPAPDLERGYNWEYTGSVQHQLFPGVGVGVMVYRRTLGNIELTDRSLITTADYASFTTPMPSVANDSTLAGVLDPNEILTVYNLNAAKRSQYGVALIDRNSKNQSIYTGLETNLRARLARGAVQASWSMERNVSVFCESNDDPNGPPVSDLYQGYSVANGGRFCDQRQFGMPFLHEFKVSGTYPVVYGVDLGVVLQSYPGRERVITWTPAASLFPGGRTNSETIILSEPGSVYQPRYNQVDINFKKNFRSGRKTFSLQADFFNVFNSNVIWTTNDAVGSSLGQVTSILMGRLPRIAFQMKW